MSNLNCLNEISQIDIYDARALERFSVTIPSKLLKDGSLSLDGDGEIT